MPGIDSFTKLMLHCNGIDNGTVFTDSSSFARTVTPFGNTKTSTAQIKFGSASALFDSSGDYLSIPSSTDFDINSGDFTVDCWIRKTGADGHLFGRINQGTPNFNGWYVSVVTTFVNFYTDNNTLRITGNTSLTAGTWIHIALVGNSGTVYLYVNGVQQSTTWTGNPQDYPNPLLIGVAYPPVTGIDGYIDEFRFSKGIARWTANFTPPIAEYTLDTVPSSQGIIIL